MLDIGRTCQPTTYLVADQLLKHLDIPKNHRTFSEARLWADLPAAGGVEYTRDDVMTDHLDDSDHTLITNRIATYAFAHNGNKVDVYNLC